MRLLVIFKAKQNKRLIWFDLLLTYTLITTVKMFAQKKLSWLFDEQGFISVIRLGRFLSKPCL